MTARSAALACFPEARVLTNVAIFSDICVSTGRSCRAMLIHCALHPVAAMAIVSSKMSRMFDLDFMVSPCRKKVGGRWSSVVGRNQLSEFERLFLNMGMTEVFRIL